MPGKSDIIKKYARSLQKWEQAVGVTYNCTFGKVTIKALDETFDVEKRKSTDKEVIIFITAATLSNRIVPAELIPDINWV